MPRTWPSSDCAGGPYAVALVILLLTVNLSAIALRTTVIEEIRMAAVAGAVVAARNWALLDDTCSHAEGAACTHASMR